MRDKKKRRRKFDDCEGGSSLEVLWYPALALSGFRARAVIRAETVHEPTPTPPAPAPELASTLYPVHAFRTAVQPVTHLANTDGLLPGGAARGFFSPGKQWKATSCRSRLGHFMVSPVWFPFLTILSLSTSFLPLSLPSLLSSFLFFLVLLGACQSTSYL